ncbi:MAG: hypothetical protein QS721_07245 [Candidatus Endonucleobacter sp. (ex Gigantidas childressi)]|nr:hypothetical protein [Candidatus Endonucleobacter sp. (ex Gigantidas childressi)]
MLNDQERLIIPVAFQVATLLAALAHPDHLLLVGSLGFSYFLLSSNLKCFECSYESIYLHIWANKQAGGDLYMHLRSPRARSMTSDETASQRAAR